MKRNAAVQQSDIDQWFCDDTARDQEYLLHFYRTGASGISAAFGEETPR
jgi:hypothetical protein